MYVGGMRVFSTEEMGQWGEVPPTSQKCVYPSLLKLPQIFIPLPYQRLILSY